MGFFIEILLLVMTGACSDTSMLVMDVNISFPIKFESMGTSVKASILFLIAI